MNDTDAALLWNTWQGGHTLPALPEACRPATPEEGYRIQARLPQVADRTLRGWKIAITSAEGQAHRRAWMQVPEDVRQTAAQGRHKPPPVGLAAADRPLEAARPEAASRHRLHSTHKSSPVS